MNIVDINRKLIGPVVSHGETIHDSEVIKNLQTIRELLEYYVDILSDNSIQIDSHYASVHSIASECYDILQSLYDTIGYSIDKTKQKIYKSDYHSPKFRLIDGLPKIYLVSDFDYIISPFDINYTLEWYQHNYDDSVTIDNITEIHLFKNSIYPSGDIQKNYSDDDERIAFWDNATPDEIKLLGDNMMLQPSTSKVGTIINHYGDIYTKRTFYDILQKYKDIDEPQILCSKDF